MFRYVGSKHKLSDFIIPKIPTDIKKYIEPFGGSMGVYFNLDINKFKDVEFIYNDINSLNCNLLKKLKSDTFIEKVKETNLDMDKFSESYDLLKSKSSIERALSWLIILTSCSDIKNVDIQTFNGSENFELFKYKIPFYKSHLSRLKIINEDYKKVLKDNDSPDTFFYIDPPYFGTENYYKFCDFSTECHHELFDIIKNLESRWILSYYNFEEMKDWYKDFNIISKKHNLSTEYIITNF